jgi:predicted nucleic acid-binding protein
VSPDPGDDYLVALARAGRADVIVSGDSHLIDRPDLNPPALTPRQFTERLT